jgi:hypothetical protein
MHRFHKVTGASQILSKKMGNFGDGFVCRSCQQWFSWRPDKDAIMARRTKFGHCTYKKLLKMLEKLKKPIYCDGCMNAIRSPKKEVFNASFKVERFGKTRGL